MLKVPLRKPGKHHFLFTSGVRRVKHWNSSVMLWKRNLWKPEVVEYWGGVLEKEVGSPFSGALRRTEECFISRNQFLISCFSYFILFSGFRNYNGKYEAWEETPSWCQKCRKEPFICTGTLFIVFYEMMCVHLGSADLSSCVLQEPSRCILFNAYI